MSRKHTILLVALFVMALGASQVFAQEVHPSANGYHPQVLYGTDPALANNIVLQIDDNVYEGNIRWVFETLRDRGIVATYFPHTRYMLHQDPELWREIVAAGNEIGYFTRNHEYGFTVEGFAEDFRLFQEELRGVLGDPTYQIRYAKPACWKWEENWFAWLETTNLVGVHTDILGPAPSINYVQGVLNNPTRGGHIMSIISFTDHIEWLEANLDALQGLRDPNGQPYVITSFSRALGGLKPTYHGVAFPVTPMCRCYNRFTKICEKNAMATITIEVSDDFARAYDTASIEDREKLKLWVESYLVDVKQKKIQALFTIMDEMSDQAEANGLTPEILEELLADDD